MANYPAMYRRLFNSQTDAIRILQQAQQDTEDMYASSPEKDISALECGDKDDECSE